MANMINEGIENGRSKLKVKRFIHTSHMLLYKVNWILFDMQTVSRCASAGFFCEGYPLIFIW